MSSRPDFLVLCYPVISFGQFAHRGSREMLLGDNPDPKLVENLSNELQVTPQTPPTFLFHTTSDTTVPVENSVQFYMALRKAGVPAEMHIYERGPHGVGLAPDRRSALLLARAPGGLAARARPAQRRGEIGRIHRTARAIGLMISPSGPWTVTSTLSVVSGGT